MILFDEIEAGELLFTTQHPQFELERVGDLRVVDRLDLGDQVVKGRAEGRIEDPVFVAQGFERTGVEDESFEELQVLIAG